MRAHQIMTKDCITVTPHTTIEEAAKIMLQIHVSGLPVMDDAGKLVGIVSESDFLRRSEIGTGRKRPTWLQFLLGSGKVASEFVHERGRKVEDVMTRGPITVRPDQLVSEALELLNSTKKTQLLVVDAGKPVGVVHFHDLLRAGVA